MGARSGETTTRVLGRYILHDVIATGGMAAVHFGQLSGPVGFSRGVAIKRLHAQFARDPDFVAMFLDEARLAARINHPNVVQTLDVVTMEGEVFIVMEYVQGESLSRLVRASKARSLLVPQNLATAVIIGTLHGLHHAHEAVDEKGLPLGLVHRDVSPQNIMVSTDGIPRELDFGVAKAAGRLHTTRDGNLKGKVAYMAPEQISNGAVTRRTDVYATCVILWELLTGKRLFEADSEAGMLNMVLNPVIARPSGINPSVPPALEAIVLKGLAPDPADRYATALEMAMDLERHAGLTSSSEVGAWVKSLATDALAKRALRVAEIESSSSNHLASHAKQIMAELASSSSLPGRSLGPGDEATKSLVSGDLPSLFGSAAEVPGKKRGRGIAVAVVVLLGALVAVGAGVALGRADRGTPAAATQTPTPTLPPSSALLTPPTAAQISEIAAPDAGPPAVVASVTRPTPTASHVVGPPPRPPRPRPPKRDDCDPPYTVDSAGHTIYKRNCLDH